MNDKLLTKLRDFLLIVANEGGNQVFLERNARELIVELDKLLGPAQPQPLSPLQIQ